MKNIFLIFFCIFIEYGATFTAEIEWASKLIAVSSEYSSKKFSAEQALGKPSVMPDFGNSPCAWSPGDKNNPNGEWIHVGFKNPIHVSQIAIAENYNPGTIINIYLYDSLRNEYPVYHCDSPAVKPTFGRMSNYFIEKTSYRVFTLKIEMNTESVNGYNQIDAIGVSGSADSIKHEITIAEGSDKIPSPVNLGPNINSEYQELAPVISPDGRTMYFTRFGHPENIGKERKEDVWVSEMDSSGEFNKAYNAGKPINNKNANFVLSVSQDGNSLLLGNVYLPDERNKRGVSLSDRNGKSWTFPKELNVKKLKNDNETGAYFLGSNGKALLCSIENENTCGGLDLYVSFLQDDGLWSQPADLGKIVNTADDEISPFLATDMRTLYYSTKGFCGFGSNDIFVSRRLDDTWQNWTEPENIGPALNSSAWDAYFTIPASGNYAYFVSNKKSYGYEDIFRAPLPDALKPKIVALASGRVLNKKTNEPVEAKISYETLPEGVEAGIAKSDPQTGEFHIVLPVGKKYGFRAVALGYLSISENLDLRETEAYSEIKSDLFLAPLEKGQKITLNNIFFEFGKYELLEDSFSELGRTVDIMFNYPDLIVEIAGHTDDIGAPDKNRTLSLNRARAVADYLIAKGVDGKRLIVKGYGESSPIAPNDSEERRKENRRVEFIIL